MLAICCIPSSSSPTGGSTCAGKIGRPTAMPCCTRLVIVVVLVAAVLRRHVVHEPRPLGLLAAPGPLLLFLSRPSATNSESTLCSIAKPGLDCAQPHVTIRTGGRPTGEHLCACSTAYVSVRSTAATARIGRASLPLQPFARRQPCACAAARATAAPRRRPPPPRRR